MVLKHPSFILLRLHHYTNISDMLICISSPNLYSVKCKYQHIMYIFQVGPTNSNCGFCTDVILQYI